MSRKTIIPAPDTTRYYEVNSKCREVDRKLKCMRNPFLQYNVEDFGEALRLAEKSYNVEFQASVEQKTSDLPYLLRLRQRVTLQTREAVFHRKVLTHSGNTIELDEIIMEDSTNAVEIYTEKALEVTQDGEQVRIDEKTKKVKPPDLKIEVSVEDFLDQAEFVYKQGKYNPCVILAAHPNKIGGQFLEDGKEYADGLEEIAFRRTSLYQTITDKNKLSRGRRWDKYQLPEFGGMYCPKVFSLRGTERESYIFREPNEEGDFPLINFVLVAPVKKPKTEPCSPKVYKQEILQGSPLHKFHRPKTKRSERNYIDFRHHEFSCFDNDQLKKKFIEKMERKIYNALSIAKKQGHDCIIVAGPYGAFKSPPFHVSMIWRRMLYEYFVVPDTSNPNSKIVRFGDSFKKIIFCGIENPDSKFRKYGTCPPFLHVFEVCKKVYHPKYNPKTDHQYQAKVEENGESDPYSDSNSPKKDINKAINGVGEVRRYNEFGESEDEVLEEGGVDIVRQEVESLRRVDIKMGDTWEFNYLGSDEDDDEDYIPFKGTRSDDEEVIRQKKLTKKRREKEERKKREKLRLKEEEEEDIDDDFFDDDVIIPNKKPQQKQSQQQQQEEEVEGEGEGDEEEKEEKDKKDKKRVSLEKKEERGETKVHRNHQQSGKGKYGFGKRYDKNGGDEFEDDPYKEEKEERTKRQSSSMTSKNQQQQQLPPKPMDSEDYDFDDDDEEEFTEQVSQKKRKRMVKKTEGGKRKRRNQVILEEEDDDDEEEDDLNNFDYENNKFVPHSNSIEVKNPVKKKKMIVVQEEDSDDFSFHSEEEEEEEEEEKDVNRKNTTSERENENKNDSKKKNDENDSEIIVEAFEESFLFNGSSEEEVMKTEKDINQKKDDNDDDDEEDDFFTDDDDDDDDKNNNNSDRRTATTHTGNETQQQQQQKQQKQKQPKPKPRRIVRKVEQKPKEQQQQKQQQRKEVVVLEEEEEEEEEEEYFMSGPSEAEAKMKELEEFLLKNEEIRRRMRRKKRLLEDEMLEETHVLKLKKENGRKDDLKVQEMKEKEKRAKLELKKLRARLKKIENQKKVNSMKDENKQLVKNILEKREELIQVKDEIDVIKNSLKRALRVLNQKDYEF